MHRFHIIIPQVISEGGFQQNVAFLCNIRLCDIPIIDLHWCIVSYACSGDPENLLSGRVHGTYCDGQHSGGSLSCL